MLPFWIDLSFVSLVELTAAMGTIGWVLVSVFTGGRA